MEDLIKVSTSELIDILTNSFTKYILNDIAYEHPAVFLKGSPGIGKSDAIKELKKNLEIKTQKEVNLIDIRLILFNPVDLRGIPIANKEDMTATWLKPDIFNLKEDDNTINLLFLDELTSCPKSIQAAAFQIALDKKIGEHKLPSNTFVIAAGNKDSDNAVTNQMPSALVNRFIHFEIANNVNSWLEWATENNINSEIISFIKKYPSMLNNECYDNQQTLVTPRSWERLSKMLNILGGSIEDNLKMVQAILGTEMTRLLLIKNKFYLYEDIIEDNQIEIPTEIEQLEQLTSLLENNINDYYNDINKVNQVLKIISELPIEFGIRVFRLISKEIDDSIDLTKNEQYKKFIDRLGKTDE